MKTNEFAKLKKLVDTILNRYRKVRKDCGIADDGWHSRSIERIAKPFINGHFTLAVVGKVSSGKSTFINALLGCKDLLPTGHDQTTCGITCIEYGEEPEVTITFGDGQEVVLKDNITGKIKPYVAIPDEYRSLPVNNIDDMILGGYDFDAIWETHERLEEETLCAKISKDQLKEYVDQRQIKDIAVKVVIKYPFNEELKGWRVIDTPGIGAIGGIETRTQRLLDTPNEDGSREVDAIIFLQNGSQTLDQTDTKKFVKEQLDHLTEADKHRLFYVLTHSSSTDFLNHKDSKLTFINENYGDKINCLTYADSLLYSFLQEIEKNGENLKYYNEFMQPDTWEEDEWDIVLGILYQAERKIKKQKDTFNHDAMFRTLEEWSHCDSLKQEINNFAKNEKQDTLRKLLNLIGTDYLGFVEQLDREKELIDGDLDSINAAIKETKDKKRNFDRLSQKADNIVNRDRIQEEFAFINEQLLSIEDLDTIDSIRTAITNLFDSVKNKEKEVFENIVNLFSDFFKEDGSKDPIWESIDFLAIEEEATKNSQEKYLISDKQVIKKCCEDNVIIPAKYGNRTNYSKKVKEFKTIALTRARAQRDKILPQIMEKIDNIKEQVSNELHAKLDEEFNRLEGLKGQLSRKEEFKAENDAFIAKSHAASKELIKLVEEYDGTVI
jgi:hypothetical protein